MTSYLVEFRSYRSLLFKFWTLCVFQPPFGGSGTTYDVHLRLIGKRKVGYLLVPIEPYSLRVTAEALRTKTYRKSAICKRVGQHPPKIRIEGNDSLLTNHFLHG